MIYLRLYLPTISIKCRWILWVCGEFFDVCLFVRFCALRNVKRKRIPIWTNIGLA